MLNLDSSITLNAETIKSPNLCDHFSSDELDQIGGWVVEGYKRDCFSRQKWLKRNEAGMDLAMQIQKDKSFPWQGCSNIKFPLITIAAMQFHARAYPAIINGKKVVDCRVVGEDPQGIQKARATRIAGFMSWQLLEQDECWEPDQDRALLTLPIMGTVFKKSYYDAGLGHNVSTLVMATDLVLDYYTKTVESSPFKTHVIPLFRNEITERVRRGTFADCLDKEWFKSDAQVRTTHLQLEKDNRAGVSTPIANENTPFTILECHCNLDLDKDGYAEPLIISVEESTGQTLRIVTRFDRIEDIEFDSRQKVIRISPVEHFTKLSFIPSPDGSIYDTGFGVLLGPLNESVDSAINQLFDSGTISNTSGGFLGRGAKIRGGIYEFSPFSWNRVDSTGDDLRKNIFPLPVREPSAVIFNLLGLLIEYTNRISGSTDMMVGENPGQNTPAETGRTMVEQGQKIYSAIFKRIWRGMKQEFRKLYVLNGIYLPDKMSFGDGGGWIAREDFTGDAAGVVPVADPTITSDAVRFSQAVAVRDASRTASGYDADAVELMFLDAIGVKDTAVLYKGIANSPPPAPDPKIVIAQLVQQTEMARLQQSNQQFLMTLREDVRVNTAKIAELYAKAEAAQKSGDARVDANRVNALNALANILKSQNDQTMGQIDMLIKANTNGGQTGTIGGGAAIPGVEAASGNTAITPVGAAEAGIA